MEMQQSDDDFEGMMSHLMQSRVGMPAAAAQADILRKVALMKELKMAEQAKREQMAQSSAPFMQSPERLVAAGRGIGPQSNSPVGASVTLGRGTGAPSYNAFDARKADIAAQYADTPEDDKKQADLVAAMNARAKQAMAARKDPALTNLRMQQTARRSGIRDAGIQQRDLKAVEIKRKNIKNAARRGVMKPSALQQAYDDEILTDPRKEMLMLQLKMMAMGMDAKRKRLPADAAHDYNPDLQRKIMEADYRKKLAEAIAAENLNKPQATP